MQEKKLEISKTVRGPLHDRAFSPKARNVVSDTIWHFFHPAIPLDFPLFFRQILHSVTMRISET